MQLTESQRKNKVMFSLVFPMEEVEERDNTSAAQHKTKDSMPQNKTTTYR